MVFKLLETKNGYILSDGVKKFVLNKSKWQKQGYSDYYLKQVEPTQEYISGLFYNKRKSLYQGKTKDGQRVIVKLGLNTAEIIFQSFLYS